jgi:hypothetical protein
MVGAATVPVGIVPDSRVVPIVPDGPMTVTSELVVPDVPDVPEEPDPPPPQPDSQAAHMPIATYRMGLNLVGCIM